MSCSDIKSLSEQPSCSAWGKTVRKIVYNKSDLKVDTEGQICLKRKYGKFDRKPVSIHE